MTCFLSPQGLLQRFFRKRKLKCCQQIKTLFSQKEFLPRSACHREPLLDCFHGENLLPESQLCLKVAQVAEHCLWCQVKMLTSLVLTALFIREPEGLTNQLTLCSFVLVVTHLYLHGGQMKSEMSATQKVLLNCSKSLVFRRAEIFETNHCRYVSIIYFHHRDTSAFFCHLNQQSLSIYLLSANDV